MACWPLASAVASRAAACSAICASACARLSWMRSPSYCSLRALIWNSSCLACGDQGGQGGLRRGGLRHAAAAAGPAGPARPWRRPGLPLCSVCAQRCTILECEVGCQPTRRKFLPGRSRRRPRPGGPAAIVDGAMAYTIRPARTRDVPMIRKLIDSNVESGRLLSKATVTLYEDIQEFCVAELDDDASLAGCGALHVMWEDLAEIRTVAVAAGLPGARYRPRDRRRVAGPGPRARSGPGVLS